MAPFHAFVCRIRVSDFALLCWPLLAAASLIGCGGGEEASGPMLVDSAGVALVELPGGDLPLGWRAEKILEILSVEEGDEGFLEVTAVKVVRGDRIVVLDRMGKRVVLLDQTGEILAQSGREGSGPGEFQYPIELFVTPDGGVGVFDMMNRRVERFDSQLHPLAPDPFQVPYYGGEMAYAGDFLVAPLADLSATENEVQVLSAVRGPDTVEVVRYTRELGGAVLLESCGMRLSGIAPLFRPSTRWAAGPGGVVGVVGTVRYEIDLYAPPDFALTRRIRRRVPVIEATAALARESIGDGMRVVGAGGVRVCDPGEVVEKRGYAKEIPPVDRIAFSPAGEIFLERWAPRGEAKPIDVLDSGGRYLGTLPAGFPYPDGFLTAGRIVVKEHDDLGLGRLAIYQIHR